MATLNSNPLDKNGVQITEGDKVYRTDPDNYVNDGNFIVTDVLEDRVKLAYTNSTDKVNYNTAYFHEVAVKV